MKIDVILESGPLYKALFEDDDSENRGSASLARCSISGVVQYPEVPSAELEFAAMH
jgi:hypothetical protein